MKIALGADHAGYLLKDRIRQYIVERGYSVIDEGTNTSDSVDYPDYALKVAGDVAAGRAERGILVCGSGIGMAITANKVPGIRAANICSEYEAQMSREHNNLNVLTLGARILDEEAAEHIVQIWLDTPFSGGRHSGRLEKIHEIEKART
ncbi:MAG TPA: ribose 5-phosphate isomerase B [Candidatus Saccharimonadales bacterium]|nr:ribose 5-phosphate isomerase B [Candidatus Saccharimonadales bacterium]